MTKTKVFAIIGISLFITIITSAFEHDYTAVTGNVCEETAENPKGFCYGELPMKGFPIAYIKDIPGISTPGIGSEDLDIPRFAIGWIANWLIYFTIIFIPFYFLNKIFKKP